jgi:hypothetical protein
MYNFMHNVMYKRGKKSSYGRRALVYPEMLRPRSMRWLTSGTDYIATQQENPTIIKILYILLRSVYLNH